MAELLTTYDDQQAAAALRSIRGTATTMRTRPSLSGLRGYSYAVDTAAGTLATYIERLVAERDDARLDAAQARAAARTAVASGSGGAVRADHPDTAKAAAKLDQLRQQPRRGILRDRIMLEVAAVAEPHSEDPSMFGLTDDELQAALGVDGNSERPRRVELVDGGWLYDGGQRRRVDGVDHIVWTLTDKGAQVYRP